MADVPLTMLRGWIVEPIHGGIVVVGNESTTIVDLDGSEANGDGPPVGVWPTMRVAGTDIDAEMRSW